jgi:hypothetical protein
VALGQWHTPQTRAWALSLAPYAVAAFPLFASLAMLWGFHGERLEFYIDAKDRGLEL